MNNILVNSRNLKIEFENIFHHKFISKLTMLTMYIMECASVLCIYRPPTKLREGNVFTGVCHLCTGGDRAVPFLATVFPPDTISALGHCTQSPWTPSGTHLLECFLVSIGNVRYITIFQKSQNFLIQQIIA